MHSFQYAVCVYYICIYIKIIFVYIYLSIGSYKDIQMYNLNMFAEMDCFKHIYLLLWVSPSNNQANIKNTVSVCVHIFSLYYLTALVWAVTIIFSFKDQCGFHGGICTAIAAVQVLILIFTKTKTGY